MSGAESPDPALLIEFGLRNPVFVARTGLATVWRAENGEGAAVCLKAYHAGDLRNEGPGFHLLRACDGTAAAKVHEIGQGAAVLEWIDGPSLGDMTRNGDDELASAILADVGRRFQAACKDATVDLPRLEDWLESLFRIAFSPDCPAGPRADIAACQAMARSLLASASDIAPLHGDLHHDNVRLADRGYCAFDAKGVLGDRGYEFANAVRNPKGAPERVRDPARVDRMADAASAAFDVPRSRILAWAAVKCALSIAWRATGPLSDDREFDLLALLRSKARAEGGPEIGS